ncbi:MAG: caspase family protein [Deltaproteobacteria bacterium]|nr:caspase family protein [Deltaproteobacteria bacterium]
MRRRLPGIAPIIAILCTLPISHSAFAVTIRYALILGNNEGADTDGSHPFEPLLHAEREVSVLRQKLVKVSNFDSSNVRTRVLAGATRAEVKSTISGLIKKRKADLKAFGQVNTLFLFYFTGHGREGRLLLKDGPLPAEEIGDMFSRMNADFSIGVFDACFSGSLDASKLSSKGIHPAPGLNLFQELPENVLSAEGRMWYVSSSSNQESYEDDRLGGVFTHFFIEALEHAESRGPGITLEDIWQYARSHTIEYTTQRKRIQVPEQYISNLRSSAPIYFSFVKKRNATLELSSKLAGRFALSYTAGNLTEVFDKDSGIKRSLAVYPGHARLIMVNANEQVSTRTVTLKSGERLIVGTMQETSSNPSLGEHSEELLEKGTVLEWDVSARHIKRGVSVLSGVGYEYAIANSVLLFARNGAFLPFRFDLGHLYACVQLDYGYDRRSYPSWSYSVHETGGKLTAGYAGSFSKWRLGAGAGFSLSYLRQRYEDNVRRNSAQFRPLIELTVLYTLTRLLLVAVAADCGVGYSPGAGANSEKIWRFSGTVGAMLGFRLY